MSKLKFIAAAVAAVTLGLSAQAQAEGRIRIAEQYGVTYLLLNRFVHLREIRQRDCGQRAGIDLGCLGRGTRSRLRL